MDNIKLPESWETYLKNEINFDEFYPKLNQFLSNFKTPVMPESDNIFKLFEYVEPQNVKCILFGEDPYPRLESANGVAFWDNEIKKWTDKTNGNSLKNILKALLTYQKQATYLTPISECRSIVEKFSYPEPDQLFKIWLNEGIFLLNTSLTFTTKEEKKHHFGFWEPFLKSIIQKLVSTNSPHFILWGNKAKKWRPLVTDKSKVIQQGHPTFIHQFMNKDDINFSPFTEIITKTKLKWI